MHQTAFRMSAAIAAILIGQTASAGTARPIGVPIDSPWALAGIGAVVAIVAARLLYKRKK